VSLNPQIAAIMNMLTSREMPPLEMISPQAYRAAMKMPAEHWPVPEPVAHVRNTSIVGPGGDIPVRIYRPEAPGPLPLLVYFHGGGFVIGDLDTHDNLGRAFCNALQAVVVSVDYRLAPEHKFPAAVEDAYAAACWAAVQAKELGGDAARLIIGGDSAGGNLAAVVCQLAKARGAPAIAHQMLIYPMCDMDLERASYRRLGKGYFLETEMVQWFWDHYLEGAAEAPDARAFPLRSEDLTALPPATVVTGEYDPLKDEGEAYARRLEAAGVPVSYREYAGVIHGFMSFIGGAEPADRAFAETVQAVAGAIT